MRDSVVLYRSTLEASKSLPDKQRLKFFNAIFEYALNDIEPTDLTGNLKIYFDLTKPLIDSNNRKYKNGCKGGRPKGDESDSPKKCIEGIDFFTITEEQYDSACERLGKDVVDRAISLIDSWFARKKDTKAKDYVGRNNHGFLRADNSFVVQAKEMIEKERVSHQPNWSV